MRILFTGFDPFGGEKINPAGEAVKMMKNEIQGAEILKLEVPTVFGKAGEVLKKAVEQYRPDAFASYYSRSSLLVANSVLCCLRTASPQGIGTQASQGSVAPLAERDSETFSIMFAVHLGLFPSAFDILPDTDPDRPC